MVLISKTASGLRDFTLAKYRDLCDTLLESGYCIHTVKSFFESRNVGSKIAIMRHDVDRGLKNALRMAELEHEIGITSTYYFRYPYTFNPEVVKKIHAMGHEVGYHYETLAKAKGDYEKAIKLFEEELESMRKVCPIDTICMHGSPLSRYDNRDLWKTYDFQEYGVIGEGYLSLAGTKIQYFTDTGRTWSGKNSLRDVMFGVEVIPAEKTDNLIQWIKPAKKNVYLNVHPERWAASGGEWIMNYVKDSVMNYGKKILIMRP